MLGISTHSISSKDYLLLLEMKEIPIRVFHKDKVVQVLFLNNSLGEYANYALACFNNDGFLGYCGKNNKLTFDKDDAAAIHPIDDVHIYVDDNDGLYFDFVKIDQLMIH